METFPLPRLEAQVHATDFENVLGRRTHEHAPQAGGLRGRDPDAAGS